MSRDTWLRQLSELLASFPEGQILSPELSTDVQRILSEAIISVLENGGQLPAFVLQHDRLDAAGRRLGKRRVAGLTAKPFGLC